MPFHFCQDELMAILAAVPFLSIAWAWFRGKIFKKRHACLCGHEHAGLAKEEDEAGAQADSVERSLMAVEGDSQARLAEDFDRRLAEAVLEQEERERGSIGGGK